MEAMKTAGQSEWQMFDDAFRCVQAYYPDITHNQIISHRRRRDYVEPRQIIAWLLRKVQAPYMSYLQIGGLLGNRDHSTVIHACGAVDDRRDIDRAFHRVTDQILDAFRSISHQTAELPASLPMDSTRFAPYDNMGAAFL